MTPLSTRISGTVRKVGVEDFATVTHGQVLVQLDDQDYQAILAEARAALAAARAALDDNQSVKRIENSKIENAETIVTQASASVDAAKAMIQSLEPDVERTSLELKRQQALLASKAATHQQVESGVANADRLTDTLAGYQAEMARAQASLASSKRLQVAPAPSSRSPPFGCVAN